MNKVILVGRLGQDPKIRDVGKDSKVAVFSIATKKNYKDKATGKEPGPHWHRVVCWNKLATLCDKYLSKGRLVSIEGYLNPRKYTDKNGVERYPVDIVADKVEFLSGNAKSEQTQEVPDDGYPDDAN